MDAVCHTQMTDWLDFNGFDVTGDADTGSLMTFETDGRRVWYTLSSAFKWPKLQVCLKKMAFVWVDQKARAWPLTVIFGVIRKGYKELSPEGLLIIHKLIDLVLFSSCL